MKSTTATTTTIALLLPTTTAAQLRGRHLQSERPLHDVSDPLSQWSATNYLVSHPFYPSHEQATCLDARLEPPPEWMTLQGGYAENHLFESLVECCERWGFSCDGDGDGRDGEQETNDSRRPIVSSSDATAASVEAPLHQKTEQYNDNHQDLPAAQSVAVASTSTSTFPTMSCGSTLEQAQQCSVLCLSGAGCPEGQACHNSVPCPSDIVAAAMGNSGQDILDLVNFDNNNSKATGKGLRNVCGSSYEDAESTCRDGYTEDFVSCDEGAQQCPLGRDICYTGLICPLPPTTAPTVMPTDRPSTSSPTVDDVMIANSNAAVEDTSVSGESFLEEEPITRKDKANIVGISVKHPPPSSNAAPVSTPSNNNNQIISSPYTIDKSTLGSISVAATSCTGGCPSGSTCVGNQAGGQLIQDEECSPCSTGQTWWPCDVQGLCWCWLDGTDRIAPATESGIEILTTDPHYTICDDILSQSTFDLIAPNHQEPYSYTGLCDAILSYNAHHSEKAFGMGDAYQRASELAAFLGNTLHESDEFKAGREYLMCADRKVVGEEVYCKPCDSGSFDWTTFTCPTSLISGTAEFNEYCQPSSVPPEACSCGNGKGQSGELEGYVPAKDLFFGRGAIQLSWNYNYIGASIALTGSPDTFCNNPDLVATEGKYAWGAGLFFWMEHSKEGTTCHTESLKNLDFGGTLNNINGGLECPAHGGWHEDAVKMRLNRYCRAAKALGLPNLMTLSRCAGLDEKMTDCLADGTCSDCQDYVGTNAGDHPTSYSPPISAGSSAAVAEQPNPSTPEETLFDSLCGEGLMALPGRPECCVPNTNFIGDGACDPEAPYNTAECLWDGGDCCKGTCKTDSAFGCKTKEGSPYGAYGPFGFYCLDPSQEDVMFAECNGAEKERVGDGKCNPEFNTAACNYDGGDCCEETCDEEFGFYPCGSGVQSFVCIDPRFKVEVQTNRPVHATTERPTPHPVPAATNSPTKGTRAPIKSPVSQKPTRNPTSSAPTPNPSLAPAKNANSALSDSALSDSFELSATESPCPSDFKECQNTGIFVGRDPERGCRFRPCEETEEVEAESDPTAVVQPESTCPSDFKECKNSGIFVSRNPMKNCRFNPCPEDADKDENVETAVEGQQVEHLCPSDFKECTGTGIFVSRDPSNHCHFKACPQKTETESDLDKHQFSSMMEAAIQGKKADDIESFEHIITAPDQAEEELIICSQDVRECRDGTFVGRDPSDGCRYRSCNDSIATQNSFQESENGVHSKSSIAGTIAESLGGLYHKGSSENGEVEAKSAAVTTVESEADSASSSIAHAMAGASIEVVDADVEEETDNEDGPTISIAQAISAASSTTVDSESDTTDPSDKSNQQPVRIGGSHEKTSMHQKGNR